MPCSHRGDAATHHRAAHLHAADDGRTAAPPALPAPLLHPDHLRGVRLREAGRRDRRAPGLGSRSRSTPRCRFDSRVGLGFDNWIEIASFFVVGLLFGAMRDTEERRAEDPQQVSAQLEDAYKQARGARDPAHQHPGLHAVDSAFDHLGCHHGGPRWLGRHGQPRGRAHAWACRSSRWCPGRSARCSASDGGISIDVAKVLAGRLPLAMRESTLR